MINILLPDEVQGDLYRGQIRDHLEPGNILMCSHGFNVHFGQVEAPSGVDTLLVAPKGPGHLVRSEYEQGGGVPSLIAVGAGSSEETKALGLAYAKGIGGTRGGVIETSFAEETETDLFGEQVVLCGGVSELVKAADKLCAYLKCLEETATGNQEFSQAEQTLKASVENLNLPEVNYFLETFVPSFKLTLDDLK